MRSRLSLWLLLVAAFVALSGCASFQTRFDFEADLIAKRGQPRHVWTNEDGTRTLEYSTQPMGETCWMYTVDAGGRVIEQFDALDHRNHGRVKPGMTIEQVQRTLGAHRSIERFPRLKEEVWDWNVSNPYPGILATYLNVHFIDGKVDRTSYTYVYPSEGNGLGMFGSPLYYGFGFSYGPHFHPYGRFGYGSPRFGWFGHYGW
ncbi:MAG: hypothetical protein LPJ91_00295 [Pseudazoarcus pumilus]|nr:hypothetical protein [Pseudazoarcus pumilus]